MNHDKDLEICNAATDGPWFVANWTDDAGHYFVEDGRESGLYPIRCEGNEARYIERFNPAYVRQLIEKAQRADEYKEQADSAHGAFSMLANIADTLRVRDFMQRAVDEGVIAMAQRVDDLENALSNLLDMPMHKGFRAKAKELLK